MTEHRLDARGLICPLPVLKARKVLLGLKSGDVLRVLVTDRAAPKDFKLFCDETGHVLQSVEEHQAGFDIIVKASAALSPEENPKDSAAGR